MARGNLPDVVLASRVNVCGLFNVDDAAKGILAADEVEPEVFGGQIKDLHSSRAVWMTRQWSFLGNPFGTYYLPS